MTTTDTTPAPIGHNQPPAEEKPAKLVAFETITDLYDEAKNWADGEPIASQEMHDKITELRDKLHEAGKEADELRKAEKEPLDEKVKAIQAEFNPYIQKDRGKVDMGKATLDDLLAVWRRRVADEKAAEAKRLADAAAAERAKAVEAMQSSRGNLAAREEAEAVLASAKLLEKSAARMTKGPTGLRTVWVATIEDEGAALDWAYGRSPDRFLALVQQMADEAVRGGLHKIPGFNVREDKVAR